MPALLSGESNFQLWVSNIPNRFILEPYPGIQYNSHDLYNFYNFSSKVPDSATSIKSYGTPGQLNSASVDGGLSYHTRTGINGTVIENAQIVPMDISILPIEFASRVDIYKNNLTPYGIPSTSGFINFDVFSFNRSYIDLSVGSYSTYSARTLFGYEIDDSILSAGFSYTSASNDFDYIDNLHFINKAYNLDYQKWSLIGQYKCTFFSFYFSHTTKEAGTGMKYAGYGRQRDDFNLLSFRSALFDTPIYIDYLYWINRFKNQLSSDDTHFNHTLSTKAERKIDFNFLISTISVINKYYAVNSTTIGYKTLDEVHLVLMNKIPLQSLEIGVGADNIYRFDNVYYCVPSISSSLKIFDGLLLSGSISSILNLPSFNDLYWPKQGSAEGNADLKPEDGVKYQTGILYIIFPFTFTTSYSVSYINNLILWFPHNGGVWKPENIKKIFSRVADFQIKFEEALQDFILKGSFSFSYNYTIDNDPSSQYYSKRIIYIPLYKTVSYAGIGYTKDFDISFFMRSCSERFVTEENTAWLTAYFVFDIAIRLYIFQFSVENVFDTQYQEIEGYPQMGRYFKGGVHIEI